MDRRKLRDLEEVIIDWLKIWLRNGVIQEQPSCHHSENCIKYNQQGFVYMLGTFQWLKRHKHIKLFYFHLTQPSHLVWTCTGPTYFSQTQKVNTINCLCQSKGFSSHAFDKNPAFGKLVARDSKINQIYVEHPTTFLLSAALPEHKGKKANQ